MFLYNILTFSKVGETIWIFDFWLLQMEVCFPPAAQLFLEELIKAVENDYIYFNCHKIDIKIFFNFYPPVSSSYTYVDYIFRLWQYPDGS